ncbi:MAG: hypothetical protein ACRD29_01420 [Acidimicrobiales bacterium]
MEDRRAPEFDERAIRESREILESHLAAPNLEGLEGPLLVGGNALDAPSSEHRLAYSDALIDLRHLIDEVRFEVAMACLIIWDFRFKLERGEVAENDPLADARQQLGISDVPFPAAVLDFLAVYGDQPPPPDEFFSDPHQHFGTRVLSTWLAGQLLDASMFRSVAVLDRVMTLLWCRAGLPLRTRRGRERLPSFTPATLNDPGIQTFYDHAALQELAAVQAHELFGITRLLRNGFTHGRRGHFETAGERLTSYETEAERIVVKGGTPETQINLAVGFFAVLVCPSLEVARQLLSPDALS